MTSPGTAVAGLSPTLSAERSAELTVEITRSVPWVRDGRYPDCWPRGAPLTSAPVCCLISRSTSHRGLIELIGVS